MTKRKIILCILDGYGIGDDYPFNAVLRANKPNLDRLFATFPSSSLVCSGYDVGLPRGTMGNSEVGHLNIGAGRIVYQDITRIHKSIEDGVFSSNRVLTELLNKTLEKDSNLHIMGLVSDGDVHSSMIHLFELIRAASAKGIKKVFIHVFTDGRDTPPESGAGFVKSLEEHARLNGARIASVSGRYYAMDRDKRWDRVQKAYECLVRPAAGVKDISASEIIANSYASGVTDEFIAPTCVTENGKPVAGIQKGDSVIFYNFRADRARELSIAINNLEELPFETMRLDLDFITMTEYREDFPFPVIFSKVYLKNILGEIIAKNRLRQLRIAETEKYAHVTFFFNGGNEEKFDGEDRVLIPSPKVPTYDLKPEMSAVEVTDRLIDEINRKEYDLIVLNLANCDMVGHTGIFEAARKAVETVDSCIGRIYGSACDNEYLMIVTADHGNAEYMKDGDVPFTAHTKNDVPFLITDSSLNLHDGKLSDIAPTMLSLMGIVIPSEMTGNILAGEKK